jgi:hypothetical protein
MRLAAPSRVRARIVCYNTPMRIGYSRRPENTSFPGRQLLIAASGVSAVLLSTWGLETMISKPKAEVAGIFNSQPKTDPRTIRLKKFLIKLHCPVAYLAEDFIHAADDNHLDWRLLPSIAIIESGGGKAYIREKNNVFGWGGGELAFPSVRAGLNQVAYELGRGPLYRRHNSLGKLHLYNPDENYAQQVLAVMRRISPIMKFHSTQEVIKRDGEYVYLDKSTEEIAQR